MKVLIISHNPISTKHNMGKTFLSLFSEFDKDELCQLYIYPSYPDTGKCASYYRVTDKEALAAIIKKKKPGKEVEKKFVSEEQGLYEDAGDESLYRNKKNKSPIRRFLRDAMWKMAVWYNDNLEKWLEKEKPDCIFVAPGPSKFIYDFALEISEKRNIPIVTYICDEYYFVKEPKGTLEKIRLASLKKKFRKLMNKSSGLAVICDEIKKEYEKEFNIPAKVFMTGASSKAKEEPKICEEPENICYFGNIRCNRFVSLCEIGRTLDSINEEYSKNYSLKIYTSEKDSEILGMFSGIKSVCFCGFLSGKEYEEEFEKSHILLHTEAFDEESIDRVRHSVSTKIADSLGSGIPLFAYAPESVASMSHLIRNGCAVTAKTKDELKSSLITVFTNAEARKEVAKNGIEAAKKYHDSKKTSKELKNLFEEIIK